MILFEFYFMFYLDIVIQNTSGKEWRWQCSGSGSSALCALLSKFSVTAACIPHAGRWWHGLHYCVWAGWHSSLSWHRKHQLFELILGGCGGLGTWYSLFRGSSWPALQASGTPDFLFTFSELSECSAVQLRSRATCSCQLVQDHLHPTVCVLV